MQKLSQPCFWQKKDSQILKVSIRDIDLHPERLGGDTADILNGCLLSSLVATVKDPDLVPHICRVLGKNCKKWTGASALRLPSPHPHSCRREEEIEAPWTNSKTHYSKLWVYGLACSPQRPTQSTWRKFFRMKSRKSVFSLKPSCCNVLERYTQQRQRLQLTSKMPACLAKSIPDQKSFLPNSSILAWLWLLMWKEDHCRLLLSIYISKFHIHYKLSCNMRQKSLNVFSWIRYPSSM